MNNKSLIIALFSGIIFVLQIICGFVFIFDFSEYLFLNIFIFVLIQILSVSFFKWKNNIFLDFIKEKKLQSVFVLMALIYFIIIIVTILKADGIDKAMLYTLFVSIFNASVCNYFFLL